MDETIVIPKPLAVGNARPQGVEIVDADEAPVMLVYGETRDEARLIAERAVRVLNEAKDFFG